MRAAAAQFSFYLLVNITSVSVNFKILEHFISLYILQCLNVHYLAYHMHEVGYIQTADFGIGALNTAFDELSAAFMVRYFAL